MYQKVCGFWLHKILTGSEMLKVSMTLSSNRNVRFYYHFSRTDGFVTYLLSWKGFTTRNFIRTETESIYYHMIATTVFCSTTIDRERTKSYVRLKYRILFLVGRWILQFGEAIETFCGILRWPDCILGMSVSAIKDFAMLGTQNTCFSNIKLVSD